MITNWCFYMAIKFIKMNIEQFKKTYGGEVEYFIKAKACWNRISSRYYISYSIFNDIESPIKTYNYELLFYIKNNNEVHILQGIRSDYNKIVDKLYYLTTGSNPLSIPDAFKVLAL